MSLSDNEDPLDEHDEEATAVKKEKRRQVFEAATKEFIQQKQSKNKKSVEEYVKNMPKTVGEASLFNYNQYFKKRYLEYLVVIPHIALYLLLIRKTVRLDFSMDLRKKMKDWHKNIKRCMKKVDKVFSPRRSDSAPHVRN